MSDDGANGEAKRMVPMRLARIVIRDDSETQFIYLVERGGKRAFPIVIGTNEAREIHRVVTELQPERPQTHQLAFEAIHALGARIASVDIVDLRKNTFYARLVLTGADGERHAVDARPSDAVALALREGCPVRVAESVLAEVRSDEGMDPLPDDAEGAEGDEP